MSWMRRVRVVLGCLALLSMVWSGGPLFAAGKASAEVGNFDVRVNGPGELAKVLATAQAAPARTAAARRAVGAQVEVMRGGLERLRQTAPGATVQMSAATAGPEVVASPQGAISGPAVGRAGIDIVRDFLRSNSDVYGLGSAQIEALRPLGESKSRNGLRMVRVEQRVNGLLVFQSETRFILDRDGRVWRSLGILVPNVAAAPSPSSARLSAPEALAKALETVGLHVDARRMAVTGAMAGSAASVSAAPSLTAAGSTALGIPAGASAAAGSAGAAATTPAAPASVVQVAANDPRIQGPVRSELVYFPVAPGVLIPAWRQVAFTRTGADWYTVVDASDGVLLWRKNIRAHASAQEAHFGVYVQADGTTPATSPAPHEPTDVTTGSGTQFPTIARTNVPMSVAQNLTFSPNGWIPDGGTTTTGNNVDAYLDTDADDAPDTGLLDNNGRPVGNPDVSSRNRDFFGSTPRDFNYTPAPLSGNPDASDAPTTAASQRGAVTNLFYISNWYHDQLYSYGFDEAAGNFQTTNFSGMGLGGDPVLAETQDGSGTDNSNFSTPPDGTSGRMQMYIFDFPSPERDGSLDATVVLHELTHGVSNRLIGNANGLIWDIGGGMGEGWSDFYSLSLSHNTNADDPNAKYVIGAYVTYQFLGLTDNYLYGIRRFPYSTDKTVNPLTWADVDDTTYDLSGGIAPSPIASIFTGGGALEVHNVGEIWALSLWGMRSRIIGDPAGAAGDVPTGNATSLQLVTDALKMTPLNPSFTDARDALIAADCATNACANEKSIWGSFADRGLGYGAVAPLGHVGVEGAGANVGIGESFKVPYLDVKTIAIDDSLGNNNGAIDPGEPIRLTLGLLNPWHNAALAVASATATLTSSTSGVTILTSSATYGTITAQGTTTGSPFLFKLSSAALCGQSLKFTLTTVSSLGTTSVDFVLRVGTAAGNGAPVTYTRTIPAAGLAIPDDDLQGVTDTQTVTDDLEIADLDFRLDSLTHTFTGDLAVELKAPNGYGTDLIYLRGNFIGDGDGDNFTNTVIDGASTNDLNLSSSAAAPFTGSWAPAFNSSIWALFGIPNLGPDPVDQLSRVNGLSTQGDWKIHVTDEAEADTGTLHTWSIIVTPKAFTCSAFTPTVAVAGTKAVAGDFHVGGTVTYTVTLTNSGNSAQADNAGNEFTDVLPAALTLVSAAATSGTAAATVATNTVTWNGALAASGGSTTITITATVNTGTAGQTISNQGTISYDSDGDGTNDATASTDDPSTPAANDATSFVVASGAVITATKAVSGAAVEGGTLTYTIVLHNSGTGVQGDNPGNEMTDVLPSTLTLVGASATSGTAAANVGTNTVTWNGAIAAGGSVTITITATVHTGTLGSNIANQAAVSYDSDGDGANDATAVSDDPHTPAAGDPTTVTIAAATTQIPTMSEYGLLVLALALAGAALATVRRRRAA